MAKYTIMSLQINPGESAIKYIGERYDRLLDYARYQSAQAGIPELYIDLLNEVLLNVLQKDSKLLDKLYLKSKGKYNDLDFFILRMIKLNAHSLLSPFRWKNRSGNIDKSVNWERLKIIDQQPVDEVDKSEILLKEYRLVVWIYKGLNLNELEKSVFEYRFINNEPLSQWTGPETLKKLYVTYNQVIKIIHAVLYFYDMTKVKPKSQLNDRQNEIAGQFIKTHNVKRRKSVI
jgi:hypothetical protein